MRTVMLRKLSKDICAVVFILCICVIPALCQSSEDFREKALTFKWIGYAPTRFNPEKSQYPSEESIQKDLAVLYEYGFEGVVTYGSQDTLSQIPRIAREVGFKGVIMGIWDIEDREELMNAVLAAEYVDAYCVGNEGLGVRYELEALERAITEIKKATARPATTTEQVFDYANEKVFKIGDWVFPNIHPFLCEVKDPQKAAQWIEKHYRRLKKNCPKNRFILFKEVGFPTDGSRYAGVANQRAFFREMIKTEVPFVYFEAFDQFWKDDLPVEPHWGLFDGSRRPKKYIAVFKKR